MILSVSRRTDIPSFYSEWFFNRLREGYVVTRNPMNPAQVKQITLSPELIECIVFWTKDPEHMMDKISELDKMGYHYYFQFTLTPYGKEIEPFVRGKRAVIQTFQQLSTRIGRDRVIWRYDPILLNDKLTTDYHIASFTELCQELQGFSNICTISFVDLYSKLGKPLKDQVIRKISETEIHDLSAHLSRIGMKYGFELRACCEELDLSGDGIRPASCIDKEIIERICGCEVKGKRDKNQRINCGCLQSVDIGIYNTCRHGCIYCYANHSLDSIQKNCLRHDPSSPILIGTVGQDSPMIK